jgi:nitroreductase
MDIINNRRSVRKYSDKLVEPEKVEKLLRAGMQSPSAKNQQPWRFLVIQEKQNLVSLSTATPFSKMLGEATLAIILMVDTSKLSLPNMYAADLGAATQNILLECTYLDLGACWIGVYGREERVESVRQILNLPDHLIPFSILSIGYPLDKDANHFVDRYDPSKVFYESV